MEAAGISGSVSVDDQRSFIKIETLRGKNLTEIHSALREVCDMARGQQKIQSQQKNAKKQAESKKKHGHDQKAAAKAALVYTCAICRTQMPDPKTFKQHFESKHPKTPLPPELVDVEA
uniref:Zinc finger protein 706 n=1 Tax=Geotrypetes seraphini TaxID=260995 RepID=A0A6P8Q278_GEOSA|nr:zinc finger protein 706 isoform X2 [Geotrypetes seraphini]